MKNLRSLDNTLPLIKKDLIISVFHCVNFELPRFCDTLKSLHFILPLSCKVIFNFPDQMG